MGSDAAAEQNCRESADSGIMVFEAPPSDLAYDKFSMNYWIDALTDGHQSHNDLCRKIQQGYTLADQTIQSAKQDKIPGLRQVQATQRGLWAKEQCAGTLHA